MIDEELCKNLRALSPGYSKMDGSYVEIGLEAADEIERLKRVIENMGDEIERLAALAQSDAEPVAWRYKAPEDKTFMLTDTFEIIPERYVTEPLYTAPPRPDASVRADRGGGVGK